MYVFQLLDHYACNGACILFLCVFESLALGWLFGMYAHMCAWVQVSECDSARCQLCPITINNLPSMFWKVVKLFLIFISTSTELIIKKCSFICLFPLKKGAQQLCDVIKDMTSMTPSRFFKLCWCYLTPLFSLVSLNLFLTYLLLH